MRTTKTSILFKILFIIGLAFLLSLIGGKVEAKAFEYKDSTTLSSSITSPPQTIEHPYTFKINGKNNRVVVKCVFQKTCKGRKCTEDGKYLYEGNTTIDNIQCKLKLNVTWTAPGRHDYQVKKILSKEATCTKTGLEVQQCSRCQDMIATTLSKKDHNFEYQRTEPATCTQQSYEVYKCSRCEATDKRNWGNTLQHGYREWDRTVQPTCTEKGYQVYKCPICQQEGPKINFQPAIGHKYVNGKCTRSGCGAKDPNYSSNPSNPPKPDDGSTSVHVHTWLDATCTEPETCSDCGQTQGEPLGHTFNDRGVCTRCGARNEAEATEWDLGENVIANLAEDGTLTIKPKDETINENKMWDWLNPSNSDGTEKYEEKISPLASNKNIKKVIIKGKIANIGSYLFYYCTNINSVTIEYSDEVGRIGGGAFFGCKRLKNIDITNNIQAIGARAFCHCQELETLDLSKATTLQRIGHEAFRDCWKLRDVTLPEGLLVIGYEAFLNCISLDYVVIPDTVVAIGTPGNLITERGIGVTPDPDGASNTSGMNNVFAINFERNKGTEHLSYIKLVLARYGIIENDDEMDATTILDKLLKAKEVIEQPRVYYYSTNQVMKQYVPTRANVEENAEEVEMVISELSWDVSKNQDKSIIAALDKNGKLTVTGNGDINDYHNIKVPWNTIRDLIREEEFSAGITTIGSYFNYYHRNITKVTLPSTLKQINWGAFFGCIALPEIEIPNSVTLIEGRAFCHCENIKTITIPASVKTLNGETFRDCYRLETVNLLGDISEIGEKEFFNCPSLKGYTVSAFVNKVGEDAFAVDFSVNGDTRYKVVENVTPQPIKYYKNSKVMQDYATANANERTFTPINIDSIEVKEKPTDQYYKGDELDISGLKVTVTYHNGTTDTNKLTKDVEDFTCEPTKLNTVGEQTIKVIYGGAETSFKVTVNEIEALNIEIKTPPTKLEYNIGDTLDTTGLVLTVMYTNGKTEDITEGYTCTPTTLTPAGNLTIEVEYKGQTTSFDVTVKDKDNDNNNNGGNTGNEDDNNDNNGGNTGGQDNNNNNNGGNTGDQDNNNNNNGGNTGNQDNNNNNNGGNTGNKGNNNNKQNTSNSSLNADGKAEGKMPKLGENVILPIAIVISAIMCIVAYKSYRKLKKM